MNFKKFEKKVIILMKEFNREMQECCGISWGKCKDCRWNKEMSDGISLCDIHSEIYPITCVKGIVHEEEYDTIKQIIIGFASEINKDCNKYEENCNKCPWNRITENGETLCDLYTDIIAEIIVEDIEKTIL